MTNIEKYLEMQKSFYEQEASKWTFEDKDPVVGNYDRHNDWADYDEFLFKGFNTKELIVLEYGCGPGRNLIKFHNRFARIDGTDISRINLEKANENLQLNNIAGNNLSQCDGKGIPFPNETYDVVFSVICLQHICVYDIRFAIMKEAYRVLRPGGYFCFQMGYGEKPGTSNYYENIIDAQETNGGFDVAVLGEDGLKDDLLNKIGFRNYKSDIRPSGPGDSHPNWIFIQCQKI